MIKVKNVAKQKPETLNFKPETVNSESLNRFIKKLK